MGEKEQINYGGATFSLAEIDIQAYAELLKNIDATLAEPIEVMNLIVNYKNPNKVVCECLKKIPLTKFCEVKKCLSTMKKNVSKYEKRLGNFLKNNPEKSERFFELKENFNTLIDEKTKLVNDCIRKCFEFLKENNIQNDFI